MIIERKIQNIPDTPYSLMEGIGGDIVFYADVIGINSRFPGFEIVFPTLPNEFYKVERKIIPEPE